MTTQDSVGQTCSQDAQSVHLAGSMTYWLSPSEMAFSGHSASQAPQEMQSVVILWGMVWILSCLE
jgi:hypothetical protein